MLNENIESYKIKNKKLKFYSYSNDLKNIIKKHGSFNVNNINQQEINMDIDNFNPQKLSCAKQIINNYGSFNNNIIDNVCFFISKNDEYALGYADPNSNYRSMIFYDMENGKEIKKINNAHNNNIYTIKYYGYSRYDMILSSSQSDIKIWNYNLGINALQSPIQNIFYYSSSYYPAFSSCVIFNKDNFHIFCVTQSYPDCIRSYNSNRSQYKNIGSNDSSKCYIDSCEIDEKKYLIVGGNKGIQVFNYPELNQYHCFIDGNDSQYHYYAKIVETKKGYNLIRKL